MIGAEFLGYLEKDSVDQLKIWGDRNRIRRKVVFIICPAQIKTKVKFPKLNAIELKMKTSKTTEGGWSPISGSKVPFGER